MFAIVVETVTEDETHTTNALKDRGYRKQEIWIKHVSASEKNTEERALMGLKVAQFLISDYYGRGAG